MGANPNDTQSPSNTRDTLKGLVMIWNDPVWQHGD
jgi:hypothetical protein